MPSSPDLLLDTSAALALVRPNYDASRRGALKKRVAGRRIGLAGHAEFEFLSTITRMPPPHRVTAEAAARMLAQNFPATHRLSSAAASQAVSMLVHAGISGGAVYDGLVALAAREARVSLLTSDRRALATYAALGVSVELF